MSTLEESATLRLAPGAALGKRVRPADRAGELPAEEDDLLDLEGALLDPVLERPARVERHDEVSARRGLARREDAHEALGLPELREEALLAREALGRVAALLGE